MIASLLALVSPFLAGSEVVKFQVNDVERSALVFKPSSPSREKAAAYFVFHGLGGNANASSRQFHIHELDPSSYVIYAEGLPNPNSGTRLASTRNGWQVMPGQNGDRDVHFVRAMLDWSKKHSIDPSRLYYVGHSNGSGFAWVVLKTLGREFNCFVGMNGGSMMPLAGVPARPTLLMTGASDRIVPPESVRRFADSLAAHNGCKLGSGSPVKVYPGTNPVYLYEYDGGHLPPKDAYEKVVKFCKAGKI